MDVFDLSWNQQKLYLHQKMYPNDPSYNLAFLYQIEGSLDVSRFIDSINHLIQNTPVLNTYFLEVKGVPKQTAAKDYHHQIEVLDYTNDPDYEQKIYDRAVLENNRPIDLLNPPLYGAVLYKAPQSKYYLSIRISHIISDGFSYYTFLEHLSKIYNERILPEKQGDFFKLIQTEPNSGSENKAKIFFQNHLKEVENLALKGIDENRSTSGLLEGKNLSFKVDSEAVNHIRTFLKKHSLTEFTFFLGCYTLFLKKITNQRKITVGIPLPNRRSKERKGVFGYFVNTLPLVIDCDSNQSFLELCNQITKNIRHLIRYQDSNLSQYTGELKHLNGRLEMNNAFTYYKQELNFQLTNCSICRIPLELSYIKFPFTMNVEDAGSTLIVNIEYASRFNHVDFENIFLTIFNTVQANPEVLISRISLLNEQKETTQPNKSKLKIAARQQKIQTAFEKSVKQYPDKVAVKYNTNELTYKELNHLSDLVAYNLLENTGAEQKYTIISLPRSEKLIAVILGVLKAGKTYVPIDPDAPVERVNYILESIGDAPMITERTDSVSDTQLLHPEVLFRSTEERREIQIKDNEDAYIIFTSGSTGKPKGVQVTHHNVIRLFESTNDSFSFSERDTWTLFHSYAFDFSIWEIFGALFYGGKLIIVPEEVTKSPTQFYELLKEEKVTILNQTPSAFRQLIKVDEREVDHTLSLRNVIFGGEKLNFSILKPWWDKYGQSVKLVNMYGITETTVHVSYYEISGDDINRRCGSIIGAAIKDLDILIVNEDLQQCPIGIEGEMLVGGEGVSKGYFKQEALTRERFIHLPHKQGVFYKTGDLAKYLPDGRIEYLHRKDNQVQLRGFRIEIEEIEFAVKSLNVCKDCLVTVHKFTEDDHRLIAYLVTDGQIDLMKMRDKLKNKLPAYMIPSHFMVVDEIPLTINGKVNVKGLPLPIDNSPAVYQQGETLDTIRNIWMVTLKNSDIEVDDNFFDVGGTSLHVTEIYYKLTEELGLEDIQVTDLFEYTTIRKLANHIDEMKAPANKNKKVSQKPAMHVRRRMNRRRTRELKH
ncbi:amino acid adenylation domain-containing protein [Rossellomorea oryzaecorticis]|uniref:Amino acid adenylation domain-containing protein n=1 Tax=Rossellomorea oryzaecorticis TaxID=1396505 RepID=A0ABU9K4U0_9BACI